MASYTLVQILIYTGLTLAYYIMVETTYKTWFKIKTSAFNPHNVYYYYCYYCWCMKKSIKWHFSKASFFSTSESTFTTVNFLYENYISFRSTEQSFCWYSTLTEICKTKIFVINHKNILLDVFYNMFSDFSIRSKIFLQWVYGYKRKAPRLPEDGTM